MVIDEVDPDPEEADHQEETRNINEDNKVPQTLTLDPVRQNKFQHRGPINGDTISKQLNNAGLGDCNFYGHKRQKTVEREKKQKLVTNQNDSLLDKWEKEYGGIKNRQIFAKKEKQSDPWAVGKNKFNNFAYGDNDDDNDVREEINEDPEDYKFVGTKARKYQKDGGGEHKQNEFELDWDEDESYSYVKKIQNENSNENINSYGVQNQIQLKHAKKVSVRSR